MDSKILDRAITSTENTVNAMIKELAAGPGKARFHAETFVHVTHEDGSVIQVPMNEENVNYALILKLVKEGTLTIKDAD